MNSDPLILDLINMISIPSINNFGSNDINQNPENEMSNYFERQLSKLGLEVESCETKAKSSLVTRLPETSAN